jgi:hypothetical protein
VIHALPWYVRRELAGATVRRNKTDGRVYGCVCMEE